MLMIVLRNRVKLKRKLMKLNRFRKRKVKRKRKKWKKKVNNKRRRNRTKIRKELKKSEENLLFLIKILLRKSFGLNFSHDSDVFT